MLVAGQFERCGRLDFVCQRCSEPRQCRSFAGSIGGYRQPDYLLGLYILKLHWEEGYFWSGECEPEVVVHGMQK